VRLDRALGSSRNSVFTQCVFPLWRVNYGKRRHFAAAIALIFNIEAFADCLANKKS
jgi:hypothetical protein